MPLEPRTPAEHSLLALVRDLAPLDFPRGCARLLRFGSFYRLEPLPLGLLRDRPHPLDLAIEDFPGTRYAEGLALSDHDGDLRSGSLFQAAWCVIAPGVAIDPTRRMSPTVALLGITIPELWDALLPFAPMDST